MDVNYSKIEWKYRLATFKIRLKFGAEFLDVTIQSSFHVLSTTKSIVISVGTERVCTISYFKLLPFISLCFDM